MENQCVTLDLRKYLRCIIVANIEVENCYQIKFDASHILHEIRPSDKQRDGATVKATKRARITKADEEVVNLDRLLPLLEVLQGRKHVNDASSLVPALFLLLARCVGIV